MWEQTINIRGKLVSLDTPKVMAIVNATPDSFAFSCTNISEAEVLSFAAKALQEGADFVDIGGCSTRPGAAPVSAEEEWRRLDIALRAIRSSYPEVIVSVDTFRASIAKRAVEQYGADIINDVSGGADPEMFGTMAELGVPYILTHSVASDTADTDRYVAEVIEWLGRKADELHRMGVKDVLLDPGYGFNKTEAQSYALLKHLADLKQIGLPVLVGLSRKSMFYKPLQTTPDSDIALAATTAAHTLALKNGADILRVHDVAAAKAVIHVIERTI